MGGRLRSWLGDVDGADGPGRLRDLVGATGGWYPIAVLTALNLVDELDRAAVAVFAPNLRRYFDISNATLGGIVGAQIALIIVVGIPLGYLGTRIDRARLLRASAAVWAACAAATAFAVKLPLFIALRLGTGIGKAAVEPVGRSLLSDLYPVRAWNRVFAVHASANPLGGVLGPLLAGGVGLAVAGDGAWRWALPLLAIPSVVAQVAARGLREPERRGAAGGPGGRNAPRRWAAGRLRRPGGPECEPQASAATFGRNGPRSDRALPLGRAVGRILGIPTFHRAVVAIGVLGFALVGQATFFSILYEEEFGVGEGGRGAIIAVLATGSLVGGLLGGPVGERVFHRSPTTAVRLVAAGIALYAVLSSASVFLPAIGAVVALQWVSLLLVAIAVSPLNAILSAISPPKLRPLAFSLLGLFVALFGGVLGGVLVGALADAHGIRVGLAAVGPLGVLGGLLMLRSAPTIEHDIETVAVELRDAEDLAARVARGDHPRALEVRGVDFAYGNLQVLFDVSLDVDDGEVIALLGTNGAGKSTVLRAVSGLGLPSRGSVRFFGEDITWLDAETRVAKGLIQVPGGKSTFPSLSVLENLRTGGYTYRRDKARLDAAVEEVLGMFPVLGERKDQAAGTLSGGEQQMVALGRAFIANPRMLLIDELSLGLAPVVVEQLLGIVRAFSARGTTLVLVEQSVNVALSIATRAYFMERGEVRFEGKASDLLERDDLLRSVFLSGADAALVGADP
jgi:branched-chain amino acid transport system ATP-binding protein